MWVTTVRVFGCPEILGARNLLVPKSTPLPREFVAPFRRLNKVLTSFAIINEQNCKGRVVDADMLNFSSRTGK